MSQLNLDLADAQALLRIAAPMVPALANVTVSSSGVVYKTNNLKIETSELSLGTATTIEASGLKLGLQKLTLKDGNLVIHFSLK